MPMTDLPDKKDMKARMKIPRRTPKHLDPKERAKNFDEVNLGFTEEEMREESFRCITCKKHECANHCPMTNDMPAYLNHMMEGNYDEAIKILRRTNPMPSILGRICPHPCESVCTRGKKSEPVSINAIERYVGDLEIKLKKEGKFPRPKAPEGVDLGKVAVVGAGPAGLTCAHDLALKGYKVTIFEKSPVPGGMMWLGIPEYRLPRFVITDWLDDLKSLGVEMKFNTPLDKERTVDTLMAEGYKAVFVAIGAYKGYKLGIPGEGEFEGFLDAIEFLMKVNLGDKTKPGAKVIVIGGGNSAIDAARTALRLGSESVNIVYRRSRAEMPANPPEIEDAEVEGVHMHYLAAPVKILGKDGKVSGMEVIKCELGEPDASGRRRPVKIPGSEYVIDADVIVPAISQQPDIAFLPEGHGFKISKWDSFEIDEESMMTNKPGVFSGGDAVTGPAIVAKAVVAGHKAADGIHKYVSGK